MATGTSPPHPQIPQPADTPTARRGEAGTALGAGQSDACRALVWPCLATQSNTELLGFYNFLKGLGTIKCSETKVSWLFYFSAGAFPAQDPDKVFATAVCHFSFISSDLKPRLTSLTAKTPCRQTPWSFTEAPPHPAHVAQTPRPWGQERHLCSLHWRTRVWADTSWALSAILPPPLPLLPSA